MHLFGQHGSLSIFELKASLDIFICALVDRNLLDQHISLATIVRDQVKRLQVDLDVAISVGDGAIRRTHHTKSKVEICHFVAQRLVLSVLQRCGRLLVPRLAIFCHNLESSDRVRHRDYDNDDRETGAEVGALR